ncbi:MAG: HEAT repeat domain-containing protein [Gemmataceae bacterium]|jgi:HEAT repeat protein|nr:HEAT repeat domain-containing protein [Gemmataceae bacterium]
MSVAANKRAKAIQSNLNPNALVRRILFTVLSGSLPDECIGDAFYVLSGALNSPDEDIRALSVIGISELGVEPIRVIPYLIDSLNDSSVHVRRRAARALGDMGPTAANALPHLLVALEDDQMSVGLEALAAIGRIGPDAAPAVPKILPLLAHEDMRVRTVAQNSLRRIGSVAVPDLVKALSEPNAILREKAAAVLGMIRASRDEVVTALLETSFDPDPDVRLAARQALDRLCLESSVGSRF